MAMNLKLCRYSNIGNTCYINSILHILQNISLFTNYILNIEHILKKKYIIENDEFLNKIIIYQLYGLLKLSLTNNNRKIKPYGFKLAISNKDDRWAEPDHHDSSEFFNFLINIIQEDIALKNIKIYNLNVTNNISNNSYENIINLLGYDQWFKSNEYSELTPMFNNQICNNIKCGFCGNINIKYELIITLDVAIPETSNNEISIYDCLDYYFTNQIEGTSTCDFCGMRCKKDNIMNLWKSSDILVITIKCFNNNLEKKIKNINYPINNFDISKYINKSSPFNNNNIYDLIGINIHLSLLKNNINIGHYISYIKNFNNNKWYLYNDDSEPVELSEDNLITNNAYMLFYHRKIS